MAMTQFKIAPKVVQQQSEKDVNRYLTHIKNILDELNSTSLQQLIEIKSSQQYVKRLAQSIVQFYSTHLRLIASAGWLLLILRVLVNLLMREFKKKKR